MVCVQPRVPLSSECILDASGLLPCHTAPGTHTTHSDTPLCTVADPTRPATRVCAPAHPQWPAKRLLHLLGVLEVEYRPFVRYGPALLAALLEGQGVDPGPFLERKVDAHILLSLEEPYLRTSLGLDDVAAKKVGGWVGGAVGGGRLRTVLFCLDCGPGPACGPTSGCSCRSRLAL